MRQHRGDYLLAETCSLTPGATAPGSPCPSFACVFEKGWNISSCNFEQEYSILNKIGFYT